MARKIEKRRGIPGKALVHNGMSSHYRRRKKIAISTPNSQIF